MNQNDSLKWYQDHTEEFIARTADVDMTPHYEAFLAHVPPGGSIRDEDDIPNNSILREFVGKSCFFTTTGELKA